jgi:CheY-like chemotaxis protein
MDDEPTIRALLGRMLEQLGFDVGLVADGDSATALAIEARREGRPFDVVILDLTVRGGMGGTDAARAILANHASTRIIVMSGHSEDDVMRDHAQYGFVAALGKPFDRAALLDVLEIAMKR